MVTIGKRHEDWAARLGLDNLLDTEDVHRNKEIRVTGTNPILNAPLAEVDPEIATVLENELNRQRNTLEMIASENFVPRAVLEAQGSVLTNKYAEGYPGRRYYGGCEFVDVAETLAQQRAQAVFGGDHVNVQPHSGAQANAAVLHAIAKPGDTIWGLSWPMAVTSVTA